ncbi:GGDEF domain-containing protein [Ferrovum sp. PN-J185]|uniref:GGDEF domain-containing protein n=1 Tax=Ferrovum sp. PN-J185 TaxID=1356306 RepID=UPI00079A13DB|nr:GGDEF domain-containing protein [Ferrovum sp. PN-J185]KXW56731.1 putative diguanylate cyclase YedQ [Ferrovum sp. PN-J185]MCC6067584.1 GGDEF domain-containing protein [Ferrovum sp. PN-J185]MDE1892056.1 GGDEF domain-containing protein [Betaproteobacteria bacterium]MDE2056495.1 GGDEF domain-containing protein [Betaproteobacteria bacterium]
MLYKSYNHVTISLWIILICILGMLTYYLCTLIYPHFDYVFVFKMLYNSPISLSFITSIFITKLILSNKRLKRDLQYDELTHLYSRREIFHKANQEIFRANRNHKPLAIIIIDVDNFKGINDSLGHPIGDYVLKNVAADFLKVVRNIDHVGRIGGDEFLIVLPETNFNDAKIVADRIRTVVSEHSYQIALNQQTKITVSIGITIYKAEENLTKDNVLTIDQLIKKVDQALLFVKQNGKNHTYCIN